MRFLARAARALRIPRRTLLGLAAAGATAFGCYSPTLPLPPPVAPDISMTAAGEFRVTGSVLGQAQVFCLNERNGAIDGQWVADDGRYDFTLSEARSHDPMQIWYQLGTDLSPTTYFSLPERAPGTEGDGGEGGAAGEPAVAGSAGAATGEGGAGGAAP